MFGFHFRKESVVFFTGFACIAIIIAFYGYKYLQKNRVTTMPLSQETPSFATDDMFITYDALIEKQRPDSSKVILIDIRPNELFAAEHIPQSTNVPFEIIDGLTIKDGFTFVIITSSGDEQGFGASVAQLLRTKNANAPIFILKGGFDAWKNATGKTISSGNPQLITDQSKVNYIESVELKKQLDAKQTYAIIDMRPHDIYTQGHIPGAINLPLDQLEKFYDKIPSGVKIITYGNSELEDFQTGVRLYDLGFFSNQVLKDGFAGWKSKGFEVQK